MRNRMYGGVRGRKMKVGGKLLHFPPTRLYYVYKDSYCRAAPEVIAFSRALEM